MNDIETAKEAIDQATSDYAELTLRQEIWRRGKNCPPFQKIDPPGGLLANLGDHRRISLVATEV